MLTEAQSQLGNLAEQLTADQQLENLTKTVVDREYMYFLLSDGSDRLTALASEGWRVFPIPTFKRAGGDCFLLERYTTKKGPSK